MGALSTCFCKSQNLLILVDRPLGKKETIFASQNVQSVCSLLLGYSPVLRLCGIYRSCACDRVTCTTDTCIVVHETLGGMTFDLRGE